MKKITILLILVPILLITSLNFTNGDYDDENHLYERNFTCSSCHSQEIVILIGKDEDTSFINIEVEIPNDVVYNFVQIDIKGEVKPILEGFNPLVESEFATLYNIDLKNTKQNKKAKTIKLKYLKTSITDTDNKEIVIQGVVTNADGTNKGDYSFYKKLSLVESKIEKQQKEIDIYPTIANSEITILNSDEKNISIIDLSGKVVYQSKIMNDNEMIDVSNYKNGYYFVLISSKERSQTFKIIVNK